MEYIGDLRNDKRLKEASDIVIFGGGMMLPVLLDNMNQLHLRDRVVAVCDNNQKMHGKTIYGIPMYGLEYVKHNYKNATYIVYNKYFVEICKQLVENHIDKIHLLRQVKL